MRKLMLVVNLTADGFLSGPQGELDWMIDDHELGAEFGAEMYRRVDTILSGRAVHLAFAAHFGACAQDPGAPEGVREFSRWMTGTPTVVLSSSPAVPGATVIGGLDGVAELKKGDGGDIVSFGGVATARALVASGLVDEYWFKIHPAVLGAGRALFTGEAPGSALRLLSAKGHPSGVASLRYAA